MATLLMNKLTGFLFRDLSEILLHQSKLIYNQGYIFYRPNVHKSWTELHGVTQGQASFRTRADMLFHYLFNLFLLLFHYLTRCCQPKLLYKQICCYLLSFIVVPLFDLVLPAKTVIQTALLLLAKYCGFHSSFTLPRHLSTPAVAQFKGNHPVTQPPGWSQDSDMQPCCLSWITTVVKKTIQLTLTLLL